MTRPDSDDQPSRRSSEPSPEQAPEPRPATVNEPAPSGARAFPEGARFSQYRVVRLIAQGGMSEVYEAVHVVLKKRVALKVLSPRLAQSSEARERFVAEAEYAARIHHPNVVDVTDIGVVDGLPYLVMTLLRGETLRALYNRKGRLPYRELVDLLLPIAAAVAAGHDRGVVHRDLKPENIFLHREALRVQPKLLDFGVALDASSGHRARVADGAPTFGTPPYMSPEHTRGDALDARTDQYALGVILYEGVTGRLPRPCVDAPDGRSVGLAPSQPAAAYELPWELEAEIARAMSRDPNERFPSMRDFAIALLPFASNAARDHWSAELASWPLDSVTSSPAHPGADETSQTLQGAAQAGSKDRWEPTVAVVPQGPKRWSDTQWWVVAAAALLAAAIPSILTRLDRAANPRPAAVDATSTFQVDVSVTPVTAGLVLDGKLVGIGHYADQLPKDGRFHELEISADGFASQTVGFRDGAPPRSIALHALPSRPEPPSEQPIVDAIAHDEPDEELDLPVGSARSSSEGRRRRAHLGSHGARGESVPAGRLVLPTSRISALAEPAGFTDQPVSTPQIAGTALGARRPKVRVIDETAPQVQVIE